MAGLPGLMLGFFYAIHVEHLYPAGTVSFGGILDYMMSKGGAPEFFACCAACGGVAGIMSTIDSSALAITNIITKEVIVNGFYRVAPHWDTHRFMTLVERCSTGIINTSLGRELQNKKLVDIPNEYLIKELKYDLTLSYEGRNINSNDISNCFFLDQEYEFGEEYANKINDLQIMNKGFHSGCIDCVFPVGNKLEDSKWWVIDWKSNLISGSDNSDCLPRNYNYENMRNEMIKHHYPLQSHLYLLALHRLLKWRLKNYQPHKHLGGYIYLFLKGLPDFELFEKSKSEDISPGIFISKAPLKRINYLDNLF